MSNGKEGRTLERQDKQIDWKVESHQQLSAKGPRSLVLAPEEMQFLNELRNVDVPVLVDIHVLEAHVVSERLNVALRLLLYYWPGLTAGKVVRHVNEPNEAVAREEAEVLQLVMWRDAKAKLRLAVDMESLKPAHLREDAVDVGVGSEVFVVDDEMDGRGLG